MFSSILGMLLLAAVILPCCGWAYVWIKTFKGSKFSELLLHTLVFAGLSLLIARVTAGLLFSKVDASCSASNKSALGLLYLMLLSVFGISCLIAFFQTVGDLISRKQEKEQNENNSRPSDAKI